VFRSIGAAIVTATIGLAHAPAQAAWLQCTATGGSATGPIGFYTTVVDVGAAPPERISALQQRLSAYAQHYDPSLTAVQARCVGFDDQSTAASHYSRVLDGEYRRLGWEHVVVVQPSDWLPPKEIVSDPLLP
jgi:hypothetical protein